MISRATEMYLENNFENNAWDWSIIQEIWNRIMQGIMSIITLALDILKEDTTSTE